MKFHCRDYMKKFFIEYRSWKKLSKLLIHYIYKQYNVQDFAFFWFDYHITFPKQQFFWCFTFCIMENFQHEEAVLSSLVSTFYWLIANRCTSMKSLVRVFGKLHYICESLCKWIIQIHFPIHIIEKNLTKIYYLVVNEIHLFYCKCEKNCFLIGSSRKEAFPLLWSFQILLGRGVETLTWAMMKPYIVWRKQPMLGSSSL